MHDLATVLMLVAAGAALALGAVAWAARREMNARAAELRREILAVQRESENLRRGNAAIAEMGVNMRGEVNLDIVTWPVLAQHLCTRTDRDQVTVVVRAAPSSEAVKSMQFYIQPCHIGKAPSILRAAADLIERHQW